MDHIEHWDAIVIGAGQAGGPLAGALGKAGWRVALIERAHIGGTCVNEGCTPTKTMIASARVAHMARRAQDYGVHNGAVSVDLGKVRERKRQIVDSFRSGSEHSLERIPTVQVIAGEARFTAPHTLRVALNSAGGVRNLRAEKIFINVGARPSKPSVAGLAEVGALDSTSIMELDHVPEHLMILGGSYIALEFGQMFRRFGARVTILERSERFLEREDEDIAAMVAEFLRAEGVEIRTGVKVNAAHRTSSGHIELELEGAGPVSGSHLLVAVGRTPNTDSLNLSATGLEPDARGFVAVNEHLETSVSGIYALGDVKGGPAFTHVSYDDYRIVRDALLHGSTRTTRERLTPYTMFTDPQLGRIGLSESEARKQGLEVKVYTLPMAHVARALETDETAGVMRAVVDVKTDLILGATALGTDGGEIMSVLQMAMMGGVTASAIRDGVFAHPTFAESLNNLFMSEPH
jgi:pyruvate/2-oxoglutarate dehydrogenase complex dihydrolipoamide dehydrogenase (E3) component